MSSSLSWLYFRSPIWMAGAIAAVCAAGLAHAGPPKESVLYNFAGGAADGSTPYAGVILDKDGALYGTTVYGGILNFGTVYRLTLSGQRWSKTILHSFSSAPDGNSPFAGVVFGNDGALYGTTVIGGNPGTPGYGIVYKLSPPANGGTPWNETVLYTFSGGADGANPSNGPLIFGSDGALYGTTENGGNAGGGTVYRLAPPTNGGTQWTLTVLYNFPGGSAGSSSPVTFDSTGALYGAKNGPGSPGSGMVYKLTPPASGTTWSFTLLHAFEAVSGGNGAPDGAIPSYATPLVFDSSGALYGTTRGGGPCQGCGLGYGTVYKLTPPASGAPPGTLWTEAVLYFFAGASDGSDPYGGVIFGDDGALYGTTEGGGAGFGTVYKLTPGGASPGTPWTKTLLYNFLNVPDGSDPFAGLVFDRHNKAMYGTTRFGGAGNLGTVFQLR